MSNPKRNPETVDRRDFVGKMVAGAVAGAGLSSCAPGPAGGGGDGGDQPTVMWRMASSFPRTLDALYGSGEVLAERVAALTNGRFQIRLYAAGEIVPPFQVMDAAQQGTVQVGHTAGYYYTGKSPVLAFDTGVPFGLTSRQQAAWLQQGGGMELMRSAYADFGLVNFQAGNTGAQMGGWFKREIATAADLRGLKMRIPGLGGDVMDRLGVTVQNLAGGEIYPALERGAIDATEWVGPYDDEKLGFHRAARFYYYPGWWEPGPSMSFLVNREAWDSLPESYQAVFETAACAGSLHTQVKFDTENPAALERLVNDGVQLRAFSSDIMSAAGRAATEIMDAQAAQDTSYARVYESWKSFRDASMRWFGTTELAYAQHAFRR